jgi:polyhydroxyalkanoate synthesis regulator phasin
MDLVSVIKLMMQMASIKAGVVAKVKVKAAKVEQRMAKRGKKSREVKQRVVQGLKTARE